MTPRWLEDSTPYYQRLVRDNGAVELRHELHGSWESYWFDDPRRLVLAIDQLDRKHPGNCYTSLNAPKPRRVLNGAEEEAPVRNEDIGWITRIPFDLDPVRPVGTAATPEHLKLAEEALDAFLALMRPFGWGQPLIGFSGNGYHVQFRARMPSNDETVRRMGILYRGLSKVVSTPAVKLDISVRSAGQILRAYGTVNRKGGRRSKVWIPEDWRPVSEEQLAAAAAFYAKASPEVTPEGRRASGPRVEGAGNYATLDAVAWFQAHGRFVVETPTPGKYWVRCPFEEHHTSQSKRTDAVIWQGHGRWPTFHCSHAHCADRTIRDVMALWGDADAFCASTWEGRSHG